MILSREKKKKKKEEEEKKPRDQRPKESERLCVIRQTRYSKLQYNPHK